jgi:hypothetical protein
MIKSLFLALVAAALIAGGAFAVKAFWIEPRSLVVTRADIAVAQWPAEARPLRIAMLADIQPAGPHVTAERVAKVVAQINALEPDLVVLLGDYVSLMRASTSHVPPKATAAVLARRSSAVTTGGWTGAISAGCSRKRASRCTRTMPGRSRRATAGACGSRASPISRPAPSTCPARSPRSPTTRR